MKEFPCLGIYSSILLHPGLALSSVFLELPLTQGQEYFQHCGSFLASIPNLVILRYLALIESSAPRCRSEELGSPRGSSAGRGMSQSAAGLQVG